MNEKFTEGDPLVVEAVYSGRSRIGESHVVARDVNGKDFSIFVSPATLHPASILDDAQDVKQLRELLNCPAPLPLYEKVQALMLDHEDAKTDRRKLRERVKELEELTRNYPPCDDKQYSEVERQRDEAIEWMRKDREAYPGLWQSNDDQYPEARRILAQYDQEQEEPAAQTQEPQFTAAEFRALVERVRKLERIMTPDP